MEVGWALHNIDPNSTEYLDLWINFSKKSSKYKEGECGPIYGWQWRSFNADYPYKNNNKGFDQLQYVINVHV